jgi:hypothetical protein
MGTAVHPAPTLSARPVRFWLWRATLAAGLLCGGALAVAEANSLGPLIEVVPQPQAEGETPSKAHPLASEAQAVRKDGPAKDDRDVSANATPVPALKIRASDFGGSLASDEQIADADTTSDPPDDLSLVLQDPDRRALGKAGWIRQAPAASAFGFLDGAAGISGASGAGAPLQPSPRTSRTVAAPKLADPANPEGLITPPRFADPTAGPAPEPQTWTLLIFGFGLAGASLRRLRRLPA